jgi:hypothetical protein
VNALERPQAPGSRPQPARPSPCLLSRATRSRGSEPACGSQARVNIAHPGPKATGRRSPAQCTCFQKNGSKANLARLRRGLRTDDPLRLIPGTVARKAPGSQLARAFTNSRQSSRKTSRSLPRRRYSNSTSAGRPPNPARRTGAMLRQRTDPPVAGRPPTCDDATGVVSATFGARHVYQGPSDDCTVVAAGAVQFVDQGRAPCSDCRSTGGGLDAVGRRSDAVADLKHPRKDTIGIGLRRGSDHAGRGSRDGHGLGHPIWLSAADHTRRWPVGILAWRRDRSTRSPRPRP